MSIRERFIDETLQHEGQRMMRNQEVAIRSATKEQSGRLLRERRFSVSDGQLTFTHTAYERFLDLRKIHRGGTVVKRRRRKIHNRFVFGTYAAIARRLMYGFTEEVIADIRQRFKE